MEHYEDVKFVNRFDAAVTLIGLAILFCILLLGKHAYDRALWRLNVQGFLPVDAIFRASTSPVRDIRGRTFINVTYVFMVNGREYTGQGLLETSQYREGQKVRVFYDPKDPARSITEHYGEEESRLDSIIVVVGWLAIRLFAVYGAYLILWGVIMGRKVFVPRSFRA
jgi:hypothetical protein